MRNRCIRAQEGSDILRWGYSTKGSFSFKEAYSIRISGSEEKDDTWRKIWEVNLWPKVALFVWLVVRKRILTGENLRKRGIIGPSQCCLCLHAEDTMGHILDSCPFAASIWDRGAMMFRRSDRVRGLPSQTIKDWNQRAFSNPILNTIWNAFPGMAMWCIWKERNARIFRGLSKNPEEIWNTVQDNVIASIKCMQWSDQDMVPPKAEVHVAENWGLPNLAFASSLLRDKRCPPSSPSSWAAPPPGVFKLNFDGTSRGNPGKAGFGGLVRDHEGHVRLVFMGAIGEDTNNSAELDGLLRGVEIVIREGFLPAIVEGDSSVLISVANRLLSGQKTEKVSLSWRLASRLERLRLIIRAHPATSFVHVRRDANRAADCLANAGVECGAGIRCDQLEAFDAEGWAQQCRQLAINDSNDPAQVEDNQDRRPSGTRRREHVRRHQIECR